MYFQGSRIYSIPRLRTPGIALKLRQKKRPKSFNLYQDACNLFPFRVNSLTKDCFGLKIIPVVISKGKGALIWDIDGHAYIDYCCSWGSLILGHADLSIVRGVVIQLNKGSSFGATTSMEYELATKICCHIPSIEKLRFVSSEAEAKRDAIRLSRRYSGKEKLIKFDGPYYGHEGELVSSEEDFQDGASYVVSLPFNETEVCRKFLHAHDDIAAVILAPVVGSMGVIPADRDFIFMLREETAKKGIILIFDEVVTGFRLGLSGAQGFYGVVPDLTCLGKIIGGGFPVAVFGGRKEIMDYLATIEEEHQADTLSANPIAMKAGLIQLQKLEQPEFYEELDKKSSFLVEAFRKMIYDRDIRGCVNQVGSMFTPFFGYHAVSKKQVLDCHTYKKLFLHLFEQGIYLSPSFSDASFLSFSHTYDQLEETAAALSSFRL